jgi:uncharacterized protein YbaP (TraB family)
LIAGKIACDASCRVLSRSNNQVNRDGGFLAIWGTCMRNNYIIWLIVLFGLGGELAIPANAAQDADASLTPSALASSQAAPKPSIPLRGSLYRVRYQDHTTYLLGTLHVGRPEFFPLEVRVTQALSEAEVLALEFDLRDTAALQSAVQKYGLYPKHDTIDHHLSVDNVKRLQSTLQLYSIAFEAIAHMKAWMVAILLEGAALEQQGYHTDLATETYLTAAVQGKPVLSLESAELQLSLFDSMTEKQQEQYLSENLDEIQSGEMRKKTKEMVDAWASADEKAFDGLLAEAQQDQSTTGNFFLNMLLGKRNPAMANKIATILKQHKASFVAIGLLHLLGPDGVPQMLAKQGFEVTRLY